MQQELAEERYVKHLDLEAQRKAAGIPTDMDRYLAGKETTD